MCEEQGYDDQFNDGLLRSSLATARRTRPAHWPVSTSEMRGRTRYACQGMAQDHDVLYSLYMTRRPPSAENQGRASRRAWECAA
jgi:hypothetical protein